MNKILGHIAVLLVFSWVTTANAMPVASINNAAGNLTITGYNDSNPLTMDFIFDFTGGTFQVNELVKAGSTYNVGANWVILNFFGVNQPFSANFNIVADRNFPVTPVPVPLDAVLASLVPTTFTGSPYLGSLDLSTFTPSIPTTLNLLSVVIGGNALNPLLTLRTLETSGALSDGFRSLESLSVGDDSNSTSRNFTAKLTVVPEPTALLLLGGGLCMFGFSKKRA